MKYSIVINYKYFKLMLNLTKVFNVSIHKIANKMIYFAIIVKNGINPKVFYPSANMKY